MSCGGCWFFLNAPGLPLQEPRSLPTATHVGVIVPDIGVAVELYAALFGSDVVVN